MVLYYDIVEVYDRSGNIRRIDGEDKRVKNLDSSPHFLCILSTRDVTITFTSVVGFQLHSFANSNWRKRKSTHKLKQCIFLHFLSFLKTLSNAHIQNNNNNNNNDKQECFNARNV